MPPDDLAAIFEDPPQTAGRNGGAHAADIDWSAVQRANLASTDPAIAAAVKAGVIVEEPEGESLRSWAARHIRIADPLERACDYSSKLAVLSGLEAAPGLVLDAAIAAARSETAAAGPASGSPFVDWAVFWDREHSEAEWTYDDVLAKGRGHAIYASHKTGKSLLMLWIAAQVVRREDQAVLYLDYEMGESDLYDRLDDMGYGPKTDFSRLRYALLPSLPPLDTREGARALCELIDGLRLEMPDKHLTVVIDTISRAVAGEENSADTFRAFYSHTGIELKRREVTWVRLDHAGKSKEQGQRGSSGKGDDVDVVWKLSKTENGLELRRELSRMSWVPELVHFKRLNDPLTYVRMVFDWPDGTQEVALQMDRLKIPVEVTVKAAQKLLHDHGVSRRTKLVGAAVRWRKQREQNGKRFPDRTESAADDGRDDETGRLITTARRFPETSGNENGVSGKRSEEGSDYGEF
jgi:KaiC/GvpD/RAD55 family RecA-like ATPase